LDRGRIPIVRNKSRSRILTIDRRPDAADHYRAASFGPQEDRSMLIVRPHGVRVEPERLIKQRQSDFALPHRDRVGDGAVSLLPFGAVGGVVGRLLRGAEPGDEQENEAIGCPVHYLFSSTGTSFSSCSTSTSGSRLSARA